MAQERPGEGAHQRLRQRRALLSMTMCSGAGSRASSISMVGRKSSATVQRNAAICEARHGIEGPAVVIAAIGEQASIGAHVAELVDDERDAAAVRPGDPELRISVVL